MPEFARPDGDAVPATQRLRRIHIPGDQQPRDFLVVVWDPSRGDTQLVEVPRFRRSRRAKSVR
jgi:hypothetical protein